MPKETLGTLREEGGCPFVGASRALFQSFPLTSSGRHNGKKIPFSPSVPLPLGWFGRFSSSVSRGLRDRLHVAFRSQTSSLRPQSLRWGSQLIN